MTTKQLKEFQDSAKKISAIEELEKIKAEIEDLSLFHNDIFKETHSKSPMRMKEDFIEIINKHISELKGEQDNG